MLNLLSKIDWNVLIVINEALILSHIYVQKDKIRYLISVKRELKEELKHLNINFEKEYEIIKNEFYKELNVYRFLSILYVIVFIFMNIEGR